jgi:NAD(P)-dependent dehydrogenase (short-subunit alcohol dehydrogenase family)
LLPSRPRRPITERPAAPRRQVALIHRRHSGIGRATAEAFVGEGAQVVVTAATRPRSTRRAALGDAGHAVRADAADLAEIDRVMEAVRARHGRIDVLFVNAGVAHSPGGPGERGALRTRSSP